jgi:hypothetical protein
MGKSQNGSSRARYVQKRRRRADQLHRGTHAGSSQRNEDTWQPATSAPGEIYTPAGRVRASGAFLSGLVTRDPRRRALQREGLRPLLFMLPLVALVGVVISLLMRLF